MWRSLIDLLQIRGATFEPVSQYVQRDVRDILESRERFSVNKKTSATKLTPKKGFNSKKGSSKDRAAISTNLHSERDFKIQNARKGMKSSLYFSLLFSILFGVMAVYSRPVIESLIIFILPKCDARVMRASLHPEWYFMSEKWQYVNAQL